MTLFDSAPVRPQACIDADPDNVNCQLAGPYTINLWGVGTVSGAGGEAVTAPTPPPHPVPPPLAVGALRAHGGALPVAPRRLHAHTRLLDSSGVGWHSKQARSDSRALARLRRIKTASEAGCGDMWVPVQGGYAFEFTDLPSSSLNCFAGQRIPAHLTAVTK